MSELSSVGPIDDLDVADEFEALREYHNAVRGWDTGGLRISWWDGWFVYAGPYPMPLQHEGTMGCSSDKAEPFRSVRDCVTALRRYVESNNERIDPD